MHGLANFKFNCGYEIKNSEISESYNLQREEKKCEQNWAQKR
jgi:hypothetical protein